MHTSEALRLVRALALVGAAFVLLVQAASAHGMSPSAVVDSYQRARIEQDLDAALGYFSDGAVITTYGTRTRTLVTPVQIRDYLDGPVPDMTSTLHWDGATVSWSERTNVSESTVRATVRDGKIQSLAYRPGRAANLDGALAPSVTPESAALSVGGLLLLGVGLLALATVRQHVRSGSILRGRLVAELRHYTPRRTSPTVSANTSGAS